jgi:hypothetical protein
LDSLVAVLVHDGDELVEERRRRRNEEAAIERNQSIEERPRAGSLASDELLPERRQIWICVVGLAEAGDEVEARAGDGE